MVRPAGAGGHAPEVVNRLQQETAKALATLALKERLQAQGRDPSGMSPADFAKFHRRRDEEVGHGGCKVD